MTALLLLGLAVLATCTVLAARPVSAWQRAYVSSLDPVVPAPSRTGLLGPLPQAALTLACGGAVLVWGARTAALPAAVLTLPVMTPLVAAANVDAVCHRLPNRLLVWAAGAAMVSTCALATLDRVWTAPFTAVGAAALLGTVSLVLSRLGSGMGLGDVKLMAVVGLWLGRTGLVAPLWALAVGFLLAGPVVLLGLALRRLGPKDLIAFGPYLVAGAALVWGATASGP